MKNFFGLLAMMLCAQLGAQDIHDESYIDDSFVLFKNKLAHCVQNKDAQQLKLLLADTIFESKDGCEMPCSRDAFMQYMFGSESADHNWANMHQIIRFGFSSTKSEYTTFPVKHDPLVFQAPSYSTTIDQDKQLIVLASKVNIREKPSLKAKVIQQASFETFRCDCNIIDATETTNQYNDGIQWMEVYLKNGTKGYLALQYTSYALEKTMVVGKVKWQWKIISYHHGPGC